MIPKPRIIIVYLLLIGATFFVHTHGDVYVPASRPLEELPARFGDWRMTGQARFDERVLEVLKPTDYISRSYRDRQGNRLALYLGYHGGGPDSGPIHSPKHCLPGSGWHELSTRTESVTVAGETIPVNLAVYQNGLQKELFVYWYQVKGAPLTSEYVLKAAEVWNSMLHNRRDSAFIRISLPVGDAVEPGFQSAADFIADFYPQLKTFLPL